MYIFALAVFLLIVSPGPGVLSLAGVGVAFGWHHGMRYLFGLFVGNNLICFAVISGFLTVFLKNPLVREALLITSASYLFYLALKIAFAGSKIALIQ